MVHLQNIDWRHFTKYYSTGLISININVVIIGLHDASQKSEKK